MIIIVINILLPWAQNNRNRRGHFNKENNLNIGFAKYSKNFRKKAA